MCPSGGIFSPMVSFRDGVPAAVAFAWLSGGVSFCGFTLDLRRLVPAFISLLGGVIRSRFLFFAGAPVPALVLLFRCSCLLGFVG